MSYSIEFYFDSESESRIRDAWDLLANAGLPSPMRDIRHRPHLSLGIYGDLDIIGTGRALHLLVSNHDPFQAVLSNVGAFPGSEGVIFLGAVPTRELLDLHARIQIVMETFARRPYPRYGIDAWVPHCTLVSGLEGDDLSRAMNIALAIALPIDCTVVEAGITEITPTAAISIIRHPFAFPCLP